MKPKLTTRLLKYLLISSTVIAVATALTWIVLQGYSFPWTGFGDFTKPDDKFVRGKTLWDWIELFIIPLVGSFVIFLLNRSERLDENRRAETRAAVERQRTEEREKFEREIATDRQHEAALQTYFDRMSELLLKEKLRTTEAEEVRDVARTRTISIMRVLDTKRNNLILQFLREAKLITGEKSLFNYANMSGMILESLNLFGVYLVKADLQGANLANANLMGAWLQGADLSGANLLGANLLGAFSIGKTQLEAEALSLKGATMPDGTKHD
jgi:Pentapeptide repeats (8 copies)